MDMSSILPLRHWSEVERAPAVPPDSLRQAKEAIAHHAGHTVREAAQEFETYFLSYLLKTMRDTVPTGFLDRKGEQVWYSLYDQEIARLATEAGGIGLTSLIEGHMPGK